LTFIYLLIKINIFILILFNKPQFSAGVRINQKGAKSPSGTGGGGSRLIVLVSARTLYAADGSGWCLLSRGVKAATGARYLGHEPRAAVALAWAAGERGSKVAAQNMSGTGHPGHVLRAAAALSAAMRNAAAA
jgi:hypothetical protein